MYLAAVMLGASATGELKAAQILFGPTRVLSFFLATILPIRFAKTLAEKGEMAVHEQMKSVYKLVIPVMGAYCLLMAVGSKPLLSLVYTDAFAGGATILMLYSAALTAKRLTRYIFAGYVFSASIALSCSWIFVKTFGGKGAVICMIFTTALVIASFARAYMKTLQTRGFSPIFATPEVS
jgi:O-antigen/teichoic acid export membrane protein